MAALSLLPALLLMAPVRVEVNGCEAHFELAALERQLLLEWPDPPEGAQVGVRCGEAWELTLQATGTIARSEPLVLPPLSASSRIRVLALIITERGRALSPLEVRSDPPLVPAAEAVAPRTPLVAGVAAPRMVVTDTVSPLRGAIVNARLAGEATGGWRVGLGAASISPLWLGPARFGPQLRLQREFLGLALFATWGTRAVVNGAVLPAAYTAEPELTVGCVTARWWQLCGGVKGIVGFGSIGASSTSAALVSKIEGPILGGGAQLGGSLRINDWLAMDVDGSVGGTWAVFATSDRVPVASLGGAFVGGQLTLAATLGAR